MSRSFRERRIDFERTIPVYFFDADDPRGIVLDAIDGDARELLEAPARKRVEIPVLQYQEDAQQVTSETTPSVDLPPFSLPDAFIHVRDPVFHPTGLQLDYDADEDDETFLEKNPKVRGISLDALEQSIDRLEKAQGFSREWISADKVLPKTTQSYAIYQYWKQKRLSNWNVVTSQKKKEVYPCGRPLLRQFLVPPDDHDDDPYACFRPVEDDEYRRKRVLRPNNAEAFLTLRRLREDFASLQQLVTDVKAREERKAEHARVVRDLFEARVQSLHAQLEKFFPGLLEAAKRTAEAEQSKQAALASADPSRRDLAAEMALELRSLSLAYNMAAARYLYCTQGLQPIPLFAFRMAMVGRESPLHTEDIAQRFGTLPSVDHDFMLDEERLAVEEQLLSDVPLDPADQALDDVLHEREFFDHDEPKGDILSDLYAMYDSHGGSVIGSSKHKTQESWARERNSELGEISGRDPTVPEDDEGITETAHAPFPYDKWFSRHAAPTVDNVRKMYQNTEYEKLAMGRLQRRLARRVYGVKRSVVGFVGRGGRMYVDKTFVARHVPNDILRGAKHKPFVP